MPKLCSEGCAWRDIWDKGSKIKATDLVLVNRFARQDNY